jgi:hypothetical protein
VTQGKQAQMPQAGDTCRLAVGVFYEPPALENAIAELCSGGFTARDICIAAKRQVLDRSLPNKNRLAERAFSLSKLGVQTDSEEYVATSRGLLTTLLDQSKSPNAAASAQASFWPDLCRRMANHMSKDGVVLLVSARDAALQNISSRILLRHSTQSVQTYEFTPPR